MAKSIKFKDNIYLDTSSISHVKDNTRQPLNTYLNSIIESYRNDLKQFGNPQKLTTERVVVSTTTTEKGITLTQPYSNFDVLLFLVNVDANNYKLIAIPKAFISKKFNFFVGEFDDYSVAGYYWISSDNKAMIRLRQIKGYEALILDSVYGIKF